MTGVCNDSVAVISKIAADRIDEYPLLMNDSTLTTVLDTFKADERYAKIASAIQAIPSDVTKSDSAATRALASITWSKGGDVFASTTEARHILAEISGHPAR